jgi:hypothetical protein
MTVEKKEGRKRGGNNKCEAQAQNSCSWNKNQFQLNQDATQGFKCLLCKT